MGFETYDNLCGMVLGLSPSPGGEGGAKRRVGGSAAHFPSPPTPPHKGEGRKWLLFAASMRALRSSRLLPRRRRCSLPGRSVALLRVDLSSSVLETMTQA